MGNNSSKEKHKLHIHTSLCHWGPLSFPSSREIVLAESKSPVGLKGQVELWDLMGKSHKEENTGK